MPGPRASFYKELLKLLRKEGLVFAKTGLQPIDYTLRSPTLRQTLARGKVLKRDLRKIKEEVFKGLSKPTSVSRYDPSLLGVFGRYRPPGEIQIHPSIELRSGEKPSVVAHELWHHITAKEGLPYLGNIEERAARRFARLVRQRAEGLPLEKIPKNYRKYLLGLAATLGGGAGMALQPEEAEAGPFKHIGKVVKKAKPFRGAISRTSEMLKGRTLFGRTVDRVVKGRGDWRHIVYADGFEQAVTKDVLNELAQEIGTVGKMGELATKDLPNKVMQAVKSLRFHKSHQAPFTTKRIQAEWLRTRQQHISQMGLEPVPYVYVDSEKVFMPEEYAKILQQSGVVTIKRK